MISAIVLAAGQSKRMGAQKMLLPWGRSTVIHQVVSTLMDSGLTDILVVTGGSQTELRKELKDYPINFLFNKDYRNGEMLTSVQLGLRSMGEAIEAALIVLGDQPQMESQVVHEILVRYQATKHKIIVPSYKMHRGHPWLIERSYWNEILDLAPPDTLRDFLIMHDEAIDYINVDAQSVIQDLDTQSDYFHYKP